MDDWSRDIVIKYQVHPQIRVGHLSPNCSATAVASLYKENLLSGYDIACLTSLYRVQKIRHHFFICTFYLVCLHNHANIIGGNCWIIMFLDQTHSPPSVQMYQWCYVPINSLLYHIYSVMHHRQKQLQKTVWVYWKSSTKPVHLYIKYIGGKALAHFAGYVTHIVCRPPYSSWHVSNISTCGRW